MQEERQITADNQPLTQDHGLRPPSGSQAAQTPAVSAPSSSLPTSVLGQRPVAGTFGGSTTTAPACYLAPEGITANPTSAPTPLLFSSLSSSVLHGYFDPVVKQWVPYTTQVVSPWMGDRVMGPLSASIPPQHLVNLPHSQPSPHVPATHGTDQLPRPVVAPDTVLAEQPGTNGKRSPDAELEQLASRVARLEMYFGASSSVLHGYLDPVVKQWVPYTMQVVAPPWMCSGVSPPPVSSSIPPQPSVTLPHSQPSPDVPVSHGTEQLRRSDIAAERVPTAQPGTTSRPSHDAEIEELISRVARLEAYFAALHQQFPVHGVRLPVKEGNGLPKARHSEPPLSPAQSTVVRQPHSPPVERAGDNSGAQCSDGRCYTDADLARMQATIRMMHGGLQPVKDSDAGVPAGCAAGAHIVGALALRKGQQFPDMTSLRDSLVRYAVACNFEFETIRSSQTRFAASCSSPGCTWHVSARAPNDRVGAPIVVNLVRPHDKGCKMHFKDRNQHAGARWASKIIAEVVRNTPAVSVAQIISELESECGQLLPYDVAYRARDMAVTLVSADNDDGYRHLQTYCRQLQDCNPGTVASVEWDGASSFVRFFSAFGTCLKGFVHCRPVLAIGTARLTGRTPRTLLTATGYDAMGRLYPVAFGVVSTEDKSHWTWFLTMLSNALRTVERMHPRLAFISDRQPGILAAVEHVFGDVFHASCMRHILNSIKGVYDIPGLGGLMWRAARVPKQHTFDGVVSAMQAAAGSREPVTRLFQQFPPEHWASACGLGGCRFDALSNHVDSLIDVLGDAHELPPMHLCEAIRERLQQWFDERRDAAARFQGVVPPRVQRRLLDPVIQAARFWVPKSTAAGKYEVRGADTPTSARVSRQVDLDARTCDCGWWAVLHRPCRHAVAAMSAEQLEVHKFFHPCFTVSALRASYEGGISPAPLPAEWQSTVTEEEIGPFEAVPKAGHRKKAHNITRHKGLGVIKQRCGLCGTYGHKKSTCTHAADKQARAAGKDKDLAAPLQTQAEGRQERAEEGTLGTIDDSTARETHPRGRPRKPLPDGTPPPKRPRGRPRKSEGRPDPRPGTGADDSKPAVYMPPDEDEGHEDSHSKEEGGVDDIIDLDIRIRHVPVDADGDEQHGRARPSDTAIRARHVTDDVSQGNGSTHDTRPQAGEVLLPILKGRGDEALPRSACVEEATAQLGGNRVAGVICSI
ncbi:hypothetical protein CBR_g19272 [Chara braunii]|uniref:SWIM-type domain-containing protein n=1 Tax=Chara braunii TaxID=69332 RepID=A0A388KXG9_CHABU|nr:hypothetical protein CBR_g19272 [Chara braunii]|eukprot:GBG74759.1 hypothetical protein CBR_g19272 [Chara braunii]